jgi:perosamine synthetase
MHARDLQPFERLEHDFAAWVGLDPAGCVACSSGTAALHLGLEALGLPPGGEVLVPDYTMVACPRAVTLAGLTPVLVDCDDRLLLDWRTAERGITSRTRVVMPVHVYGRRCDPFVVWRDNPRYPIKVVEDLAEAHGVRPYPLTDAACWSFYRNKVIAGEEGGLVYFKDPAHAAAARELRSLGFTAAHDFRHRPRGHNYRLSNAHAGLILSSLAAVGANLRRRRAAEGMHDELCPDRWRTPPRDVPWVYDLRVPGLTRARMGGVVRALHDAGVPARHGFLPMHAQPEYGSCRVVGAGGVSRAGLAADEVMYLPCGPTVTAREVEKAWDVLRAVLGDL